MKTTKQIQERIDALKLRQKDGLDLRVEIHCLMDGLYANENDIKQFLINSIEAGSYKGCRELLWVLED